jgi:polysaccharide biosynthesis/export protein
MRTRTMLVAAAALTSAFACTQPLAASASTQAPPAASVVAPNTFIHPGDQLNVAVFGDQTLTQSTLVLADGTIDYPLIGRVPVGGKTPDQAAAAISTRLLAYVRHPVVTVAIAQLGQPDVLVLGDVKNPGKYQLRSDAHLTDALAAAGGFANTNGAFPEARVSDAQGNVTKVSLEMLLQKGDTSLDRPLSEGSVVYVPGPVQFTVDVTGAVDHPGDIQVNEGDHLSVAIAKAGDSQNAHSDLNHIRVIHTADDGKQTTTEVNLYQALKAGDEQADVALTKGDVIYVPEAYQHRPSDVVTGLLYILTRFIP